MHCSNVSGWIKDQTGDWQLSFYVTAILFLVPAILMLMEPLVISKNKRLGREKVDIGENVNKPITVGKNATKAIQGHGRENVSLLIDNVNSTM